MSRTNSVGVGARSAWVVYRALTWGAVFCGTLAYVTLATAVPVTWTNGNGTGLASDPLNWSGGFVPTTVNDVILNGTSTDNIIWDGQSALSIQTVNSWTQTADYTGAVTFQIT